MNGKHRDNASHDASALLNIGYTLLGDGRGNEWYDNPEYTRGVTDFIVEAVGLPETIIDPGGEGRLPFVLGMIHTAHLLADD